MTRNKVCVLGSTGSVGVNTLAVAKHLGLRVTAISAHNKYEQLIQQAIEFNVEDVVISNEAHYKTVKDALASRSTQVHAGHNALEEIAASENSDTVITAIVGAAGLASTVTACQAGKRVGIANKEPLVIAGELVMETARNCKAEIIPIDSEHSAIFQCLESHQIEEVDKIILTGSGGALRDHSDLSAITKTDALKHPNWSMGDKITIDSATLMNKGLELIEAHHLFNIDAKNIDVIIHPQSIIHSMVCYKDGSTIAQLAVPDMQIPIQYALTYPKHKTSTVPQVDFLKVGSLDFKELNHELFPGVQLAKQSLTCGALGPCALNAANECAVDAFLNEKQGFLEIYSDIRSSIESVPFQSSATLDELIQCDQEIRQRLGK